ncbi:MAG TPA: SUF system NifU family Fe-S cluster assembly protein [Polyangiaceae bacterium]|nr:SUF system NifU family Fe-S cluster assembly protein [Polyangiaceae bacterium]
MSDLRELYQEMILDHGRRPRNYRFPDPANREADGHNPLCGDRLTIKLLFDDGIVKDVGFQGAGCAISTAAASTMTEVVMGKSAEEVEAVFQNYHALVTGTGGDADTLGKLAVFAGVAEFPMRVKCATLCWHTLRAALQGRPEAVSTEEDDISE